VFRTFAEWHFSQPMKTSSISYKNFTLSKRIKPTMGEKNCSLGNKLLLFPTWGKKISFLCLELIENANKCKACQFIKTPNPIILDMQSCTHYFELLIFILRSINLLIKKLDPNFMIQVILVQRITIDVTLDIPINQQ
jgi:hypothetical protein